MTTITEKQVSELLDDESNSHEWSELKAGSWTGPMGDLIHENAATRSSVEMPTKWGDKPGSDGRWRGEPIEHETKTGNSALYRDITLKHTRVLEMWNRLLAYDAELWSLIGDIRAVETLLKHERGHDPDWRNPASREANDLENMRTRLQNMVLPLRRNLTELMSEKGWTCRVCGTRWTSDLVDHHAENRWNGHHESGYLITTCYECGDKHEELKSKPF